MQTLSAYQLAFLTHLHRACGGMTTEIGIYLSSFYFTRARGRALVLQPHGAFGYFYLAPGLYADAERRKRELSAFIGIVTMLDGLKRSGQILYIQPHDAARPGSAIRALGDSFETPVISAGKIVLNPQGDYTSHPDTIKNEANADIYIGTRLDGPLFDMVNAVTGGLVYMTAEIDTLINTAAKPAPAPTATAVSPGPTAPPAGGTAAAVGPEPASPGPEHAIGTAPEPLKAPPLATAPLAVWTGKLPLLLHALSLALLGLVIFYVLQIKDSVHGVGRTQARVQDAVAGSAISRTGATSPAPAPVPQTQARAAAGAGRQLGFDLSKWNGALAARALATPHVGFVILRATSGMVKDSDFEKNWALVKGHSVARGAYHFYHASEDPVAQAKMFLKVVGRRDAADIAPIIDFEMLSFHKSAPTQNPDLVRNNLLKMLNYVEAQTGQTPILYTNVEAGDKYLDDPKFTRFPLWIADWTNAKDPKLPSAWKSAGYLYWQRSKSYTLDGSGPVPIDLDVYNGSPTEKTPTLLE